MRRARHDGGLVSALRMIAGGGVQPRGRRDGQSRSDDAVAERLARGLGWFSIGLGLPPIVAPGGFARLLGVPDDSMSCALARVVGLREVVAGVGILTQARPAGWLWARVTGDVMDLALLGAAFTSRRANRGRLAAATASVVGVTALDLFCAVQLSRGYGATWGRAKEDHVVHVKKAITINRPRADVYQFWHDFRNLPRFMKHLDDVQVTGDRRSHWRARAPAGTTVEWDAELVDDRPNELIAWRSVDGSDVDNSGSVRFVRAPDGRGTEVHVELEYAPPGGALGATVAKLFGEEPEQQVQSDLRRFKQVLETGEVVYSEATVHGRPHPARPPEGNTGS